MNSIKFRKLYDYYVFYLTKDKNNKQIGYLKENVMNRACNRSRSTKTCTC